jgi:hypothetical protein
MSSNINSNSNTYYHRTGYSRMDYTQRDYYEVVADENGNTYDPERGYRLACPGQGQEVTKIFWSQYNKKDAKKYYKDLVE